MEEEIIYPPRTDAGWYVWGGNACPLFVEMATDLGIAPSMATAAQTVYDSYATSYLASKHPLTRSKITNQAKTSARQALRRAVAPVVAAVQANHEVSDEDRVKLGLKPRDIPPTPAPVITVAPSLVAMMTGRESIRIIAENPLDPDRRAKPQHVRQIAVHTVLSTDGTMPPQDKAKWPLTRLSGKKTIDLFWDNLAPNTTVWIACRYVNSRNEPGPFSTVVSVQLQGNDVPAASSSTEGGTTPMSIAA